MRVFPQGWGAEAEAFQPAAIAGDWPRLQALMDEEIPSLTHAVVVLARHPGELLTDSQRRDLWRAFRVPIFEQIVAANGALLAAECEAHDGLHVESPKLNLDSGFGLTLAPEPCGCGRTTPRLKQPSRDRMHLAAAI
ncbi:MAG TPA: hypothetical protein VH639_09750 [Bryobacteraceae bacterium]